MSRPLVLDAGSESLARSEEPDFHGIDGSADPRRDLLEREILYVLEFNQLLVFWREALQQQPDLFPVRGGEHGIKGTIGWVGTIGHGIRDHHITASTQKVHVLVAGDCTDPRIQLVGLNTVQTAVCGEQGLLSQIFCIGVGDATITQAAVGHDIQRLPHTAPSLDQLSDTKFRDD
jgi:hypothetical protein